MLNKIFKNFILAGVLVSAPLYPASIKTPTDLSQWMIKSFVYQDEEIDYWKTPEETIKDKSGDCEDFAILSKKVLKDLGHKAYVIVLVNKDKSKFSHAVCLFQEKNKTYSVIDNQYYYSFKYKNWKKLLNKIYSQYKEVYNCVNKNMCQEIYIIGE